MEVERLLQRSEDLKRLPSLLHDYTAKRQVLMEDNKMLPALIGTDR